MTRITLFTLLLPLTLWSQSTDDGTQFPDINDGYGGGNISNVFFGFIAAQRGDSCTDSSHTLYSALSYSTGGLPQSLANFECDTSSISLATTETSAQATASITSGLHGSATNTFSNNRKASIQGSLEVEWEPVMHQVVLHLTDVRLTADISGSLASTLSLVVWKADEDDDTLFQVSDIIWESTATLVHNQISTAGTLQPTDFCIHSEADSTFAIAGNLQFTVNIPASIALSDVVVQIDGRVYEPEEEAAPALSIEPQARQDVQIKIYPNPAADFLTVSFGEPLTGQIFIHEIGGRVATSFTLLPNSKEAIYNVANLTPGIYVLQVRPANEARYKPLMFTKSSR